MNAHRLEEIVRGFNRARVLVLGDFFLDQYFVIDPRLAEVSLETGLTANQVVGIRNSPGAAGTVASNLAALGVGSVQAVGIIGQDGNGFSLTRELEVRGIDTSLLLTSGALFTPTYLKPMKQGHAGTEVEMERMDIKNRRPLPRDLEDALIRSLHAAVDRVDAIVIGDQVQEPECGVITSAVRAELARLGVDFPEKFFLADSRTRIGLFEHAMIKPNRQEAVSALGASSFDLETVPASLYSKCQRPVFLTCGEDGIIVYDGVKARQVPAVKVTGPIDIVGAGDSTTAGIIAALCSGASLTEAAAIGNLVASITIRQLGTTGTASPEQLCEAIHRGQFKTRTA